MKKIIAVTLILMSSCVIDTVHETAIVKNESNYTISVLFGSKVMGDSELFYRTSYPIKPNSSDTLFGSRGAIGDDSVVHLYVFNSDTVNSYIKRGAVSKIVENALLARIDILVDSLEKNKNIVYK